MVGRVRGHGTSAHFYSMSFMENIPISYWMFLISQGCLDGSAPTRVRSIFSFSSHILKVKKKRIEARLENLRKGDDWQFMCVTTPADIDGQYYSTPAECSNQVSIAQ